MHRATLLTGSNSPESRLRLQCAAQHIAEGVGEIVAESQLYTSPAWGFQAQREFCNQALVVATSLSPHELLEAVLNIEQQVGRNRPAEAEEKSVSGQRYASREIDIDIIFYDDAVIDTPRLKIPHPLMHEREFVLRPLCEIMPDMSHPVLGCTVRELLEACGSVPRSMPPFSTSCHRA